MSRSASVNLFFGEGRFDFRLGIDQLEQLEEVTRQGDARFGPRVLLQRIASGAWLVRDVRETLRLGLVGGGMAKQEAFDLVGRHLEPGALLEAAGVASAVLSAALVGGPEDEAGAGLGEQPGEGETGRRPSPTDASTSDGSTASARPSDGTPAPQAP